MFRLIFFFFFAEYRHDRVQPAARGRALQRVQVLGPAKGAATSDHVVPQHGPGSHVPGPAGPEFPVRSHLFVCIVSIDWTDSSSSI